MSTHISTSPGDEFTRFPWGRWWPGSPLLKLHTCAVKWSGHFGAVCLDHRFPRCRALLQTPSADTMGPLCFGGASVISPCVLPQSNAVPLQPGLLLGGGVGWGNQIDGKRSEIGKRGEKRAFRELDCGTDKFHAERVYMFLSCYRAFTLTHGVWRS